MKKELYSQILENVSYNYLGQFVNSALSFLISIYIIRVFTVEEFGYYQLLMTSVPLVMMFSSLGIPSIIQRYIPEFYEKGNIGNIKKIVIGSLICRIFSVALLLLIVGLFIDPILSTINAPKLKEYVIVFGLALFVLMEVTTIQSALTALFLQKYNVLIDSLGSCLRFALYYHALQAGEGLSGIIFYFLVINIILLVAYLITVYFQVYKLKSPSKSEPPFLKRVSKYGFYSYFNEASYSFYDSSIDFYIISIFMGPTQVGYYSFALVTLKKLIAWLPAQVVANLVLPIFTRRYHEKGDRNELNSMFKLHNKKVAFFIFPAMIAFGILVDKIIVYVFDPKYLECLGIFYVLIFFEILSPFVLSVGPVTLALEKANIVLLTRIFVIYNILAAIILIQYVGLIGVAFATGSAVLFKGLLMYKLIRKHIHLSYPWKSLMKIGINSLLMGAIIYLLRPLINDIYTLLFISFVSPIIYLIIAYFNKAFDEKERAVFNRILKRPVFVF